MPLEPYDREFISHVHHTVSTYQRQRQWLWLHSNGNNRLLVQHRLIILWNVNGFFFLLLLMELPLCVFFSSFFFLFRFILILSYFQTLNFPALMFFVKHFFFSLLFLLFISSYRFYRSNLVDRWPVVMY